MLILPPEPPVASAWMLCPAEPVIPPVAPTACIEMSPPPDMAEIPIPPVPVTV